MPAIHMLGGASPGRKTYRTRGEVSGRVIEFIPERGMITIRIEEKDGGEKYDRVSRRTFLERAYALQQEVAWLRREACKDSMKARRHRDEARILQDLVDCMVAAAQAAKDQGDPIANLVMMSVNQSNISRPVYESEYRAMPSAPSYKTISAPVAPTLILPSTVK
jgi:hypothetical protein